MGHWLRTLGRKAVPAKARLPPGLTEPLLPLGPPVLLCDSLGLPPPSWVPWEARRPLGGEPMASCEVKLCTEAAIGEQLGFGHLPRCGMRVRQRPFRARLAGFLRPLGHVEGQGFS